LIKPFVGRAESHTERERERERNIKINQSEEKEAGFMQQSSMNWHQKQPRRNG